VQWQVSTDGGSTFNNVPGATSTTYTFTPTLNQSSNQFRALFTNVVGSNTSNAATLLIYCNSTINSSATMNTSYLLSGPCVPVSVTVNFLASGPYVITLNAVFSIPLTFNAQGFDISVTFTTPSTVQQLTLNGCQAGGASSVVTIPNSNLTIVQGFLSYCSVFASTSSVVAGTTVEVLVPAAFVTLQSALVTATSYVHFIVTSDITAFSSQVNSAGDVVLQV